MKISNLIIDPRLRGIDLMGPQRISKHREILVSKKMIRKVFEEIYNLCVKLEETHFGGLTGERIEIGAGTSFFRDLYPGIISTDIEADPRLDKVVDAQNMPFADESIRTLFCINAFHHFPEPRRFFTEAMRVLRPGGGCVVVDPAYGFVANFIYRRLFAVEGYDQGAKDWGYVRREQDQLIPNQALTYLVFFRDQEDFQRQFPQLKIVEKRIVPNFVRYLLSGGLNFRQLVPNFMVSFLRAVEVGLTPLHRHLGLHQVIVLKKQMR